MKANKEVLSQITELPGMSLHGNRLSFLDQPLSRGATKNVVGAIRNGADIHDIFHQVSTATIISLDQHRSKVNASHLRTRTSAPVPLKRGEASDIQKPIGLVKGAITGGETKTERRMHNTSMATGRLGTNHYLHNGQPRRQSS